MKLVCSLVVALVTVGTVAHAETLSGTYRGSVIQPNGLIFEELIRFNNTKEGGIKIYVETQKGMESRRTGWYAAVQTGNTVVFSFNGTVQQKIVVNGNTATLTARNTSSGMTAAGTLRKQ